MPDHDSPKDRERTPGGGPEREPAPAPPTAASRVLDLQRAYGNAAVSRAIQSRTLQRNGPPAAAPPAAGAGAPAAAAPGAATLAEVDGLLAQRQVDVNELTDLLGRLAEADVALLLFDPTRRVSFARKLNLAQMRRAVLALRFPLSFQLEWVQEAAGSWRALRYADVKPLIDAANQAHRSSLDLPVWRQRFVEICGPATMTDAVIDLGFPLARKLDWMLAEGTTPNLIIRAIRSAPEADLAGVTGDAPLMQRVQAASLTQWQEIEEMLRSGLLGRSSVSPTIEGVTFRQQLEMFRSGIRVTKGVRFVRRGNFAPNGFEALRDRMIAVVGSSLNNKFKVQVSSPAGGPQQGDGDYPIGVQLRDDQTSAHRLNLHGGAHGRGAVGGSSGDIYELGQPGEALVPDVYIAHECAHLMLGASDEYADAAAPARQVFTDHSLMGDFYAEGTGAAEIKARHFQHLVQVIARFFPGRNVAIVP